MADCIKLSPTPIFLGVGLFLYLNVQNNRLKFNIISKNSIMIREGNIKRRHHYE